MCGHKGILHGGASASALDQFFGLMNCIPDIHGFTGQLSCSYKKIILCPSTVLIRGIYDRVERRKHYFKAVIYDELVFLFYSFFYNRMMFVLKQNVYLFNLMLRKF